MGKVLYQQSRKSTYLWTVIVIMAAIALGMSTVWYNMSSQVNRLLSMEQEQVELIRQYMKGERVIVVGEEGIRMEVRDETK